MVVGEHATIELRRREARDIVGMHSVVNPLSGPGIRTGSDRSFQINDEVGHEKRSRVRNQASSP